MGFDVAVRPRPRGRRRILRGRSRVEGGVGTPFSLVGRRTAARSRRAHLGCTAGDHRTREGESPAPANTLRVSRYAARSHVRLRVLAATHQPSRNFGARHIGPWPLDHDVDRAGESRPDRCRPPPGRLTGWGNQGVPSPPSRRDADKCPQGSMSWVGRSRRTSGRSKGRRHRATAASRGPPSGASMVVRCAAPHTPRGGTAPAKRPGVCRGGTWNLAAGPAGPTSPRPPAPAVPHPRVPRGVCPLPPAGVGPEDDGRLAAGSRSRPTTPRRPGRRSV